ncbi:HlyD family efflux transporter periplasmic adaptor subunit [Nodularia sp. UHCC 0506]|uniref:HlyD family efflux transporter periplasmic adaptor subunit n=1 Tax=Nodularia sp. UHCC 0506 TaxID=3110243 RepID=UPI002B21D64D|nr:HlyD family efflux transporter periplasmic adaptor subunit [Nodularia sp. UHCC 0506]MEA5517090.1 HlyD family efflux transporter periplasmic adaptor subunit [Nodularia sp. UHCC 0506]
MSEYNGKNNPSNPTVTSLNQVTTAKQILSEPDLIRDNKFIPKTEFDNPIILKQSPLLSRAIIWGIVGVTSFGIIWACVAKIGKAVKAEGKLEPQAEVKEVQAPISGVVASVNVEDGSQVKTGDVLIKLDTTTAQSNLKSLTTNKELILQENRFYRSQIQSGSTFNTSDILPINIPDEIRFLTKNRNILISENQMYLAQIRESSQGLNLSLEEKARLRTIQDEFNSRIVAGKLEIEQLENQLSQREIQLANAKSRLSDETGYLIDLTPLAKDGGISRIQFGKQRQEVGIRQAEVDQLLQEIVKSRIAISQAKALLDNTESSYKRDWLNKIEANKQRIAEIDSQINKIILENEKKLTELDNQINQAQQVLKYQEIRATKAGTVFDLKAYKNFVANSSQSLLKIVPDDALIAKVCIPNQNSGFVKVGMDVDVRIASFPLNEFGDIKGKLVSIGSDALPPEQIRPYSCYPAKIRLEQQYIQVGGKREPLQSGMSVSVNIKERDRTVASIFTESLSNKLESLKFAR